MKNGVKIIGDRLRYLFGVGNIFEKERWKIMDEGSSVLHDVLQDESARRQLVEKMMTRDGVVKEGNTTFTVSTSDGRTVVVSVPPVDLSRPRI